MDALVFFGLLIVVVIFGLPIAGLVAATRARDAAARAHEDLRELRESLARQQRKSEETERRLTAWIAYFQEQLAQRPSPAAAEVSAVAEAVAAREAPVADQAPEVSAMQTLAVAPSRPSPGAPKVDESARDTPPATPFAPSQLPSPEAAPVAPASDKPRRRLERLQEAQRGAGSEPERTATPAPAVDWERLVGVRLFAWLGGGALFLAAALFLHYSIQKNLISPEVRVAIGLVAGAVALVLGDRLRVRTPLAGDAISGAGVGILYAALFAARVLYDLVDTAPAFAGMVLVTVTAGTLAVRRDAYFIALLGLIGGMATPWLLSSGHDRPVALFVYVTLLSAGVLFVARLRRWPSLGLIALALASVLFVGWSSKYLSAARVPYALGAVALVSVLFALTRFAEEKTDDAGPRFPVIQALAVAGALVPFVVAIGVTQSWALQVEPFPLALHLVVVSAVAVWVARAHGLEHLPLAAGGMSLLALVGVVGSQAFPLSYALSFLSLSLVPLAFFAAAVVLRGRPEGPGLYRATLVVSAGALLIMLRAEGSALRDEALTIPLLYLGVQAACLVALGALRRSGLPLLLSQVLFVPGCLLLEGVGTRDSALAVVLLAAGAVFFALPATHERLRADRLAFVSSSAALPIAFLCAYGLARTEWGNDALGAIAIACAALAVAMIAFLRRPDAAPPGDVLALRATFGAQALGFLTAAVAILLANEWLTISWALEVAAVAWLYRRLPHRGLVWFAGLLALGVSVRLLVNPALWEYHPRGAIRILNHYLYTFGVPALALYAAAWLLPPDAEVKKWKLRGLFQIAATAFLFLLMNVEIADFYSTGERLTFRWSGGGLAEDMTYSLGWGAFAMALLLAGMAFKKRPARIGALVVLIMTIAKVFLHDLWELGSLYRVGSIVGLAVALLGVSFLTQRFILPKERA